MRKGKSVGDILRGEKIESRNTRILRETIQKKRKEKKRKRKKREREREKKRKKEKKKKKKKRKKRGGKKEKNKPLVHVNVGLLADNVSETTTNTTNLGQSEHDLVATFDVGVVHTKNVLELVFLQNHRLFGKKKREGGGGKKERGKGEKGVWKRCLEKIKKRVEKKKRRKKKKEEEEKNGGVTHTTQNAHSTKDNNNAQR